MKRRISGTTFPSFWVLGGVGLLIGPVGLLFAKRKRDRVVQDEVRLGMDVAFIGMLFMTSLTGLLLLVFRATPAMGILLAVHLGVVFSLFITMPYSKMVHGLYRFTALVRYAKERRTRRSRTRPPADNSSKNNQSWEDSMFKIDRRLFLGVTLMAAATLLPLHPASAELKGLEIVAPAAPAAAGT